VILDYTLRTVALGTAVLGIVSGSLGAFAVLRRQSLLGDAMSHAALPGIVLAFLLTRSKTPVVLLLGAILAGWLAALLMSTTVRHTRIKQDSALGLLLSVFFGFGLVLLTFVQRIPDAGQAGLNRYLFGQAATLLQQDIVTMAALGGVALAIMALFWKEFKLLSFDPASAPVSAFRCAALDTLLTTLIVVAIVVGLQAVGVVLMSAMIVAPAAAARQWTNRLSVMVALSALFGALSGVSGALLSSTGRGVATGPAIVLVASVIVLPACCWRPIAAWLPSGCSATQPPPPARQLRAGRYVHAGQPARRPRPRPRHRRPAHDECRARRRAAHAADIGRAQPGARGRAGALGAD
jgi:manganese/zinc/iron transport system permease protein